MSVAVPCVLASIRMMRIDCVAALIHCAERFEAVTNEWRSAPNWSIHCGCGTGNYKFIWGMAGENQVFDDMDPVKPLDLQ